MFRLRNTYVLLGTAVAAILVIGLACKKQQPASTSQSTDPPQGSIAGAPAGSGLTLTDIVAERYTWGPAFEKWYGKEAPDFTVTDITGKTFKLSDQRGKQVMVVFWATWCPPCRQEIPDLIKLRDSTPQSELAMIGLSLISERETTDMVKHFVS